MKKVENNSKKDKRDKAEGEHMRVPCFSHYAATVEAFYRLCREFPRLAKRSMGSTSG